MATYDINFVNTVKNSCSQHRAKHVEDVLAMADSSLKMRDIAKELGISYQCVRDILQHLPNYSERVFEGRSRGRAEVEPKYGESNSNYKGYETTAQGYKLLKMPDWYTGKPSSGGKTKYVFEHVLIMCQAIGLTELPEGFIVHHADEDKSNNDLSNLVLMSRSCHKRLHEGVTTMPLRQYVQVNGSAKLWGYSAPDEEIVCSSWRQLAG